MSTRDAQNAFHASSRTSWSANIPLQSIKVSYDTHDRPSSRLSYLFHCERTPYSMSEQNTFAPRVAIVTGAAQGIGEAIALRLADDGLDIAVNDIESKREQLASLVQRIEAKGRRAISITGDVASEQDVVAIVEETVKVLGALDVMVANAGISLFKPMFDTTVEDIDRIMAINVRGVMLCFKHAAAHMVKQGHGGRLIGACSGSGKKGIPNMSAYSASKFAVRGLTQACAGELAPHKITVNSYAPGSILTPMVLHPDDAINGGPASTAKKVAGLPLKTPDAEPDVIASLVSYLVKPESYFITGQSINVNGGLFCD
ncbi:NAD-P-binding protein [Laetiporus sulphureus 93-53]|uniref:NAD-P-binding protein n=1 Tax=Laetiporus sulphureus 93-53 TaxID=1314785 RepID=A0A165DFN7_9APHY|nr:NAD-P-binding protein [Laetiporus sulphureus 93-53]KZT04792.1 NAD-P-binding protein [Laetiporus sulphureus 93-53]